METLESSCCNCWLFDYKNNNCKNKSLCKNVSDHKGFYIPFIDKNFINENYDSISNDSRRI